MGKKIFGKKVAKYMYDANGNAELAIVMYIAFEQTCDGFRCRECPIQTVCSHNPSEAPSYAMRVLKGIDEQLSQKK